ncbi:MAG: hypothetical protein SHS37scaffold145_82 [Phage 71_18]|nr:MAG: hypothetical protein SHS37scaffold145_82 [Phage 71_18]
MVAATRRGRTPDAPSASSLVDTTAVEATPARAIVASARRIPLNDQQATKKAMGKRQNWQSDAWVIFHNVGEVKYVDKFLANAVGRLLLFPAIQPDPNQPPIKVDDSALSDAIKVAARDALGRLKSEIGGQAAIMRAIALSLEVAGECFLIGHDPVEEVRNDQGAVVTEARPEYWEVRSTSEVTVNSSGKVSVKENPGERAVELEQTAFLLRIWEQDPEWQNLPDSPLHGIMLECDELMILSRGIRAEARSRLPAGLLLVPSELSFGPADITEGDEDDPLAVKIMQSMVTPVADEGDPSALVPLMIRGKGEHLEKIRHLLLDRPIDQVAASERKELLQRIAQGLNAPPELALGMSNANHWTAWQVDASTFSAHVEPRALGILQALTVGVFQPLLAKYEGMTPELAADIFIWYDASQVVTQPERPENAKAAHAALTISDAALREALKFSEDDAPSEEELARRLGMQRGLVDAPMAQSLLAMYLGLGSPFLDLVAEQRKTLPAKAGTPGAPGAAGGEAVPAESTTPAIGPPAGDGSAAATPPPAVAASAASDRRNIGQRLAGMDRSLFVRLRVAADGALQRALEKAGARLRSKSARTTAAKVALQGVENPLAASVLGPAMVAAVGATDDELLAGAFDGLRDQWDAWVSDTQAAALATATAAWSITEARAQRAAAEQDRQRDEAWAWMLAALLALARQRLYDPSPDAPEEGEHDTTLAVPAALIREAMARAGGAGRAGLEVVTTERGGVELMTDAGSRPAGGVATGDIIIGEAIDAGFSIYEYLWEHGDPGRPFEPHADLDGQIGEAPDADVFGGWFPGDHRGCTCQLTPLFTNEPVYAGPVVIPAGE